MWISLIDHINERFIASEKAIALARETLEHRFEKVILDQLRQYPDRAAHEKLEARLSKLEENAALTTGKLAATIAAITLSLATILSLFHLFQTKG